MIGQQLYTRAWYAYGDTRQNPGVHTAAFSPEILNGVTDKKVKTAIAEDLEQRANLPDGEGVRTVLARHTGASLFRIFHPYPGTTATSRSVMVADVITGDGRATPFTHAFIMNGQENENFLLNPSSAFDLSLYESYESVVRRTTTDKPMELNESLAARFLETEGKPDLDVFYRCGFDRKSFAAFFATLILEVGRTERNTGRNNGKIVLMLPENQLWGKSESPERLILAFMSLLPMQFRSRFGAVSYWDSNVTSPNIAEIQLIISGSDNLRDFARMNTRFMDLGSSSSNGMVDDKIAYASFIWDNLNNSSEIQAFERYMEKLLGAQTKNATTLGVLESCYVMWQAERNGFEVGELEQALIAAADIFAGRMKDFPEVIAFVGACLDKACEKIKEVDAKVDSALAALLHKEEGYHSYFENAVHFLIRRVLSGNSSENAREVLKELYVNRDDAPSVEMDKSLLNLRRFLEQLPQIKGFVEFLTDLAVGAVNKPQSGTLSLAQEIIMQLINEGLNKREWKMVRLAFPYFEILAENASSNPENGVQAFSVLLYCCFVADKEYAEAAYAILNKNIMGFLQKKDRSIELFARVYSDIFNRTDKKPRNFEIAARYLYYMAALGAGHEAYSTAMEVYPDMLELYMENPDKSFLDNQLGIFEAIFRNRNVWPWSNAITGFMSIEKQHVSKLYKEFPLTEKRLEQILAWMASLWRGNECPAVELKELLYEYLVILKDTLVYQAYLEILKRNNLHVLLFMHCLSNDKNDFNSASKLWRLMDSSPGTRDNMLEALRQDLPTEHQGKSYLDTLSNYVNEHGIFNTDKINSGDALHVIAEETGRIQGGVLKGTDVASKWELMLEDKLNDATLLSLSAHAVNDLCAMFNNKKTGLCAKLFAIRDVDSVSEQDFNNKRFSISPSSPDAEIRYERLYRNFRRKSSPSSTFVIVMGYSDMVMSQFSGGKGMAASGSRYGEGRQIADFDVEKMLERMKVQAESSQAAVKCLKAFRIAHDQVEGYFRKCIYNALKSKLSAIAGKKPSVFSELSVQGAYNEAIGYDNSIAGIIRSGSLPSRNMQKGMRQNQQFGTQPGGENTGLDSRDKAAAVVAIIGMSLMLAGALISASYLLWSLSKKFGYLPVGLFTILIGFAELIACVLCIKLGKTRENTYEDSNVS
jgi:hypothetical protein